MKFGFKFQLSISFCGLVIISVRIPDYTSINSLITGERQIAKNFEGSDHGIIMVVVSQNLPEGTE
jgi:hypothetical protein